MATCTFFHTVFQSMLQHPPLLKADAAGQRMVVLRWRWGGWGWSRHSTTQREEISAAAPHLQCTWNDVWSHIYYADHLAHGVPARKLKGGLAWIPAAETRNVNSRRYASVRWCAPSIIGTNCEGALALWRAVYYNCNSGSFRYCTVEYH